MKLKKILAGLMAGVIAAGAFMTSTANAVYEPSNPDVIYPICEKTNVPVWKSGESKTLTLSRDIFSGLDIEKTGWYYSIPISTSGTVEIKVTTFDRECINFILVNSETPTYRNTDYDDSNWDFNDTSVGKALNGYRIWGEKNGNKEVIEYQASVGGGNDGDGTDADSYSGVLSFDVKRGDYKLLVFPDYGERKVSLTVTYPNSSDTNTNDISALTVNNISNKAYTGKAIKPSVTIKDGDKKLVKGTDYTVSYKNNTKIGTATVTITGKGDYTGTKTLTFKIVPKKVTLTGKTSGTNETLSWKKSAGATGYEIYRSVSGGKFTKLTTTKSLKYTAKLTAGKSCQFKVIPYTIVNGKKFYGSWSNVIKTK